LRRLLQFKGILDPSPRQNPESIFAKIGTQGYTIDGTRQ